MDNDDYVFTVWRAHGSMDGHATLDELTRRIRETEAAWDGLSQVTGREIGHMYEVRHVVASRLFLRELFSNGRIRAMAQYSLITNDQMKQVSLIDQTSRDAQREIIAADKAGDSMAKAMILANAVQQIRSLLDPLMPQLMTLRGTPLGFRTDKDKDLHKPGVADYPLPVIRDALATGLLKGFRPVGNEINVIAGSFYGTKEGLKRIVREWPGLTDLRITKGVPQTSGGGALVAMSASWKLDGVEDRIDCRKTLDEDTRIPVRVNEGMGVDAILGKAESKLYRRVYERLTGSEVSTVDDVVDEIVGEIVETTEAEQSTDQPEEQPRKPVNLAEIYSAYLQRLAESDMIRQTTDVFHEMFREGHFPWSKADEENAQRELDRRQDEIRKSRGQKQGQLV